MTEECRNWETVGAPDELEKTKFHRDYLRSDRDGWCKLYEKAEKQACRLMIWLMISVPFATIGLWQASAFMYRHLKVIWS